MKKNTQDFAEKLKQHLEFIYKDQYHKDLLSKTQQLINQYADKVPGRSGKWDQNDVFLITYGDTLKREGEKPLNTLENFLTSYFGDSISVVHLLPFFPYSSDDGFSVIDYYKVRNDLGEWENIEKLGQHYDLMADLVLNHISTQSEWFQNFLKNQSPGRDYFIVKDPDEDLSKVVRPRSTPLLTAFDTTEGKKHVWTTFSSDQVDLNFKNPGVFLAMLEIMLYYLSKGIRIIRLDAIAFLWKEDQTSCLHLPETHEFVKLFRDIFDYLDPGLVLITETNVPNEENLSYFGDGDEAHMIYQFNLPPLLLYSFFTEDSYYFANWAATLPEPPEESTFLNFTASHDGIGVRPLEGIVPEDKKKELFENIRENGGMISTKVNADGTESPYELNTTYLDALKETRFSPDKYQIERFISSQAVMTAFKGVPAFYIHSLLGTENDYEGYRQTQRARKLNRKQWDYNELVGMLEQESKNRTILDRLLRIINVRKQQEAFHPDAKQEWMDLGSNFIAFRRKNENQEIISVTNVTSHRQGIRIEAMQAVTELINEDHEPHGYAELLLPPFATRWFSSGPGMIDIKED
ncbi:MAG: sugar phosphorylase [Bacteroidales bacterium]|nr:sugar phosphorylase [Bacteroidales bacterium]MCF8338819.1 sugar phosphorylase [Bacteroidales bacterium]